jgi:hypothetical protein
MPYQHQYLNKRATEKEQEFSSFSPPLQGRNSVGIVMEKAIPVPIEGRGNLS